MVVLLKGPPRRKGMPMTDPCKTSALSETAMKIAGEVSVRYVCAWSESASDMGIPFLRCYIVSGSMNSDSRKYRNRIKMEIVAGKLL